MSGGSKPKRKDLRTSRPRIVVHFGSKEEVEFVKKSAQGASTSEYCRERILLSNGFRDPVYDITSRLLLTVNLVQNDLFTIGDVIRALTSLRKAIPKQSDGRPIQAPEMSGLIQQASDAITRMIESNSERMEIDHDLVKISREIVNLLTDREINNRSSAITDWRKPAP